MCIVALTKLRTVAVLLIKEQMRCLLADGARVATAVTCVLLLSMLELCEWSHSTAIQQCMYVTLNAWY